MVRHGDNSDGEMEDLVQQSRALQQQKRLCDEAMGLVNAGVALQNASPPDAAGAERKLSDAVRLMDEALAIEYPTAEERDASQRLASKMSRYTKMIRSQLDRGATGGGAGPGAAAGRNAAGKFNILEMDHLPGMYDPVVELLTRSTAVGDIFESLKTTFGFQEGNVLNQKEHLLLLLTNFKEQSEEDAAPGENKRDPQKELELAKQGITRFHSRVFANYTKWCKYVSQKPAFTTDPLVDIVLFFLIWGEAGNFRQVPECLCFLLHNMLPQATSRSGEKQPGDFLAEVIRPLYTEVKKDNDKKTFKGARAPHTEIRNYDDFNEFFWTKKCLKYNATSISEAFAEVDKKGQPKTVKKTFVEKRTWLRAILSFRRIFFFNCALFLAVVGLAINVIMVCPDTPILYGSGVSNGPGRAFVVLDKNFTVDTKTGFSKYDADEDGEFNGINNPSSDEDVDPRKQRCILPMLATCLGVELHDDTFRTIPLDFKALLTVVPFTSCTLQNSGRCGCYVDLVDRCFHQNGTTETRLNEGTGPIKAIGYNQSLCIPKWRKAVQTILMKRGPGRLNCETCHFTTIESVTNFAKQLLGGKEWQAGEKIQLIEEGEDSERVVDTSKVSDRRQDQGMLAMLGGAACVALILVCEIINKVTSGMASGYVGRYLPVPILTFCRYTCFWLLLLAVKLTFDYKFMIKSLVETSLFIWYAREDEYLQYSNFIVQVTFHNIVYILFLWIPAFFVFMYDAQIFYALLSVIFGSFAGFNLRIGELRSFRVLRLSFKSIPRLFNKKIVPNMHDTDDAAGKKKKKKPKKGEASEPEDSTMPVRHFERVSMGEGDKPLTVKSQMYSNLLEGQQYDEMNTPSGDDDDSVSRASSTIGPVTGISGADFERTVPFAIAWNRCLMSLRESDVISDRELNVLSYLIDAKGSEERKLYPPAFLTAGKLDESIDIIVECAAVFEKLNTDKKKKEKALQKVETTMRERLLKDDLRIQSLVGSYRFSSQVVKLLLGDEHRDLHECFDFIEEMVTQKTILQGLKLKSLHECRSVTAELMKSLLEVPRGTKDNDIKFQKAMYRVIDCMEAFIGALKKVLGKQENLVQILNDTPLKQRSFFFPGDAQMYSNTQLMKIVNSDAAMDIVSRAYQLLTVDNFDAEPRSEEGRRRLRFFANSLFMEMPDAKAIRKIRSLTVSTPYYSEIVLYSVKELTTQNDDSVKLLYYLKTIYPAEWENFLERIHAKDMEDALKKNPEEVQLWASYRGQTLARTVRGMMYNEEAIRFLHWLEIADNEVMHQYGCQCNMCKRLDEMVALKFNYVCTCQIYGKMKEEQRQQAADLEYLLKKHPSFRIAYVDGPKKMKEGPPKFYSVLIRALGDTIVEVYRVELPGDPIIGEGKPENQNHAIIFSRGELLQCIDMNQDGYFEECLKMPNLLSTMDRHSDKQPLTIIGFREHVFTGAVSNLASFMSIQELSFVSLGQRMLALNHVRQHYGHPDIFDKLFAMTTGGTAKASKGINLSEDIFAGFNTTLRGGRVSHEEFIQVGKGRDVGMQQLALFEAKLSSGAGECVISRDALRMATRLDFFRLHSWFYGNLGWYFTQTMTVFGVYFFIYGKVYQALSGMDSYFLSRGGLGIGGVLNTSWAFQFGFLLVVPVVAVVGVEKGFRHGVTYLVWNCLTLGPLFFTFQMGSRMHYFDRTLIHGGAKYRATGRGFTIKHEKFAELYRFYAFSHFYRGVELVFLLLLFLSYGTFSWCNCSWEKDREFYNYFKPSELDWVKRCYANYYHECVEPTNQNYGIMSFSLWIIAATWLWAPFIFNPSGLDWDKLIEDFNDWQNWLQTANDSAQSWLGWWSGELEYLEHSTWFARMVSLVRKTRFFFVGYGIYLQLAYNVYYRRRNALIVKNDIANIILAGAMFVFVLFLACTGYVSSRIKKKMTFKQRKLRKMKFVLACCGLLFVMLSFMVFSLRNLIEIVLLIGVTVYWFLQVCIYRLQSGHVMVRTLARGYDRAIGWVIFGPILFIAMFLPFFSAFQQRVMFNNAFTSGLEVSKLFANEAASSSSKVVKVKKVVRKKKRDD